MTQKPSFNVLIEPWIPVERLDGARETLGIREALLRAHELRGVSADNPLDEFAIQRLLITLLTDAYRPLHWEDLENLIGVGRFDAERLNDYATACGPCFDLFDEKRPFLQVPCEGSGVKEVVAAVLFPQWPTGNNHIFFNHALEDAHAFSPAQCARALCGTPLYTTYYGNQKGKGVTGVPPVFFLYAGTTLFETLAMSMTPKDAQPQLDFDDPPVLWRDKPVRADFRPCAKASLLSGLLSRPLDIRLIPEALEDGGMVVRRMRYGRGWDYDAVTNWRDPHIVLRKDGKPLMGRDGWAVWRDLGVILREEGRPVWTKNLDGRTELLKQTPPSLPVRAYVPVMRFKGTAFYLMGWFDEPISINAFLFSQAEKAELLGAGLEMMEGIGNRLSGVFVWTVKQLETRKKGKKSPDEVMRALAPGALTAYLSECRAYLFSQWIPLLEQANTGYEWDVPLREAAGDQLGKMALAAFDRVMNEQSTTAYLLKWRALARPFLRGQIVKLLKKGGWLHDDANPSGANPDPAR